MRSIKKRDIIIIVSILAIALLSLPVISWASARYDASRDYVYIYLGGSGEPYAVVAWDHEEIVTVEQANGKRNEVKLTADSVVMHDSSCSNHDCIAMGEITRENMETRPMRNWIVCLPNYISVEVRLHGDDN